MLMIPVTIGGVILIAQPPFIFGGHEYDENTLSGIFYSFFYLPYLLPDYTSAYAKSVMMFIIR